LNATLGTPVGFSKKASLITGWRSKKKSERKRGGERGGGRGDQREQNTGGGKNDRVRKKTNQKATQLKGGGREKDTKFAPTGNDGGANATNREIVWKNRKGEAGQ